MLVHKELAAEESNTAGYKAVAIGFDRAVGGGTHRPAGPYWIGQPLQTS